MTEAATAPPPALCGWDACAPFHAATVGELAAHLVEVHAVGAAKALATARETFTRTPSPPAEPVAAEPEDESEDSVPRKGTAPSKYQRGKYGCSACGKTGHTARSRHCPARNGNGAPETAPAPARPASTSLAGALQAEIAALDVKRGKLIAALRAIEEG